MSDPLEVPVERESLVGGDVPNHDELLASLRTPPYEHWSDRLGLRANALAARVLDPANRTVSVIVGSVLVVALAVGGLAYSMLRSQQGTASGSQRPGSSTASRNQTVATSIPMATTSTTLAQVAVHAAGAVVNPGLYHMDGSQRVADLIEAAGGLAADADVDRINLAAPLSDGSRLYVPRIGETSVPAPVGAENPAGSTGSSEPSESNPLDLNAATADQLDALPGVGPATAKAIVDYRSAHGPFRSVEGLMEVRGIGPAKLEAIRGLVRV